MLAVYECGKNGLFVTWGKQLTKKVYFLPRNLLKTQLTAARDSTMLKNITSTSLHEEIWLEGTLVHEESSELIAYAFYDL
jgi:hypothetical protein